jgi:threonine dehydrogenase-like Zn-dependent dehydrogenase
VLAANLETAINGVWDARPQVGDRVTVIGAGTVGCLVAWIAGRIAGCDVELVDVNPDRASIARALGVRFADPASARSEATSSSTPAGRRSGSRWRFAAGFEATIVEMSWYGDQAVSVPLGEGFTRGG